MSVDTYKKKKKKIVAKQYLRGNSLQLVLSIMQEALLPCRFPKINSISGHAVIDDH